MCLINVTFPEVFYYKEYKLNIDCSLVYCVDLDDVDAKFIKAKFVGKKISNYFADFKKVKTEVIYHRIKVFLDDQQELNNGYLFVCFVHDKKYPSIVTLAEGDFKQSDLRSNALDLINCNKAAQK